MRAYPAGDPPAERVRPADPIRDFFPLFILCFNRKCAAPRLFYRRNRRRTPMPPATKQSTVKLRCVNCLVNSWLTFDSIRGLSQQIVRHLRPLANRLVAKFAARDETKLREISRERKIFMQRIVTSQQIAMLNAVDSSNTISCQKERQQSASVVFLSQSIPLKSSNNSSTTNSKQNCLAQQGTMMNLFLENQTIRYLQFDYNDQ